MADTKISEKEATKKVYGKLGFTFFLLFLIALPFAGGLIDAVLGVFSRIPSTIWLIIIVYFLYRAFSPKKEKAK